MLLRLLLTIVRADGRVATRPRGGTDRDPSYRVVDVGQVVR